MTDSDNSKMLAGFSEQQITLRLAEVIRDQDEDLFRLMMLGAVPRIIDRELMATLSGRDPADQDFNDAFERFLALPFVRESSTGYGIQSDVRSTLVESWRDGSDPGRDLADVEALVIATWQSRYNEGVKDENALAQVGPVMREVDAERFRAASAAVKRSVELSLIELTFLEVETAPTTARSRFTSLFEQREDLGDYLRCELLARCFIDSVKSVEDELLRDQLTSFGYYYRSRAANGLGDWDAADEFLDEAEELVKRSFTDVDPDPPLDLWVILQRVDNLRGRDRLRQALEKARDAVATYQATVRDRYNEHNAWSRLASAYETLWDIPAAVEAYESAILSAKAANNRSGEIMGRLSYARSTPDHAAAARHMVAAFVQARLGLADAQNFGPVNVLVGQTALAILGPNSARLMALLSTQARLLALGTDPSQTLAVMDQEATGYEVAGLPQRAAQCLDEAVAFATEFVTGRVAEVAASRASLSMDLGEPLLSVQANLAVAQDPLGEMVSWTRARCYSNAALALIELSEPARAISLATLAQDLWTTMDHPDAVAFMWAVRAEALRLSGDLPAARDALEHAGSPQGGYDELRLLVQSRIAAGTGELASAADAALSAYELSTQYDDKRTRLKVGAEALQRVAGANRLSTAAELAAEIALAAEGMSAFASWAPSEASRRADAHAAQAVRVWIKGIGDRDARIRGAREHLATAKENDATEPWFEFEAALIETAAKKKDAAGRHLDTAIQLSRSDVMRASFESAKDVMAEFST